VFLCRCESQKKSTDVRLLKEYVKQDFFGKTEWVAVYDYFCYCTNLKRLNATQIHALYGQRAESENWIEHVKFANMRNFWGNNHIFLRKKCTQKSKNA
jgi:hypothetical protein